MGKNVYFRKKFEISIAALNRLTQDVQHSTRYPKTHVGGPDLDLKLLVELPKTPQKMRQLTNPQGMSSGSW